MPVLETSEQEKANYKIKVHIDEKVLEKNKEISKRIISKCKDKIHRFKKATLQEAQHDLWMDPYLVVQKTGISGSLPPALNKQYCCNCGSKITTQL